MTSSGFSAKDWIDRLTPAICNLAKVQVPYLEEYYRQNPSWHTVDEEQGSESVAFPLDDLRLLTSMARNRKFRGKAESNAPCSRRWIPSGTYFFRIPPCRGS